VRCEKQCLPVHNSPFTIYKYSGTSIFFSFSAHEEEVANDDFGHVALFTMLVGVGAVGDFAFDAYFGALVGVFRKDFRLFAPDDKVVPGCFSDFFALLIFVGFVGRDVDMAYDFAGLEGFQFYFGTQVTDELNFVSSV